MNIRPQDLPELRAELSQQLTELKFFRPIWDLLKEPSEDGLREAAAAWRQLVDDATLFHVSDAMTNLVATAATSLGVFTPEVADLPAKEGLVLFDGDLRQEIRFDDGCTTPLRGLLWGASESRSHFMVTPIADAHDGVPVSGRFAIYPALHFNTRLGTPVENAVIEDSAVQNIQVMALLLATCLLIQQPLSSESQAAADRAARKRLRRAGHEPAPVRVIELRRPKSTGGHGDGDREYHHQWIVRGHWRQQWHPKRQVHRPVWIAPHIKGPEGAPLIGGEKVYALKR